MYVWDGTREENGLRYEFRPGLVLARAAAQAQRTGWAFTDACTEITEPRVLYVIEEGKAKPLAVCKEPDPSLVKEIAEADKLVLRTEKGGIPADRLVGTTDIAKWLEIDHSLVHRWYQRYPEFPREVCVINSQRVYDRDEIAAWVARWRPEGRKIPQFARNASSYFGDEPWG